MIGNKALYLLKLRQAGFKIPRFLVLQDKPRNNKEILEKIESELSNINYFAVRSSVDCEDSEKKSFAGYFYSALGVKKDNLYEEVIKVINSYEGLKGNVIVQEFIPGDKAGVIFSNAGDNKIVINSNFGLCNSVVKGQKCDEYILNKNGGIISKVIPDEKQAFLFDNDLIKIGEYKDRESLEKYDIKKLLDAASKIESLMGEPQDIEWCFKDKILYILQSRPITKSIFDEKEFYYFDSANIAESYSGIVLPLTCSFASYIYKIVYEDLLAASGASRKKIWAHKDIFDDMLGFFYGRIYYNMNNWYKMMSFIPGYQRNKKNLELMITSNVRQNVKQDIFPSIWLKIKYPFLFLFKLIFFSYKIKRFKKLVKKELTKTQRLNINKLNFEQCGTFYNYLNKKLLKNWYITVENDFIVMSYFGILKKLFSSEVLRDVLSFDNVSTQQIKELKNIAPKIKANQFIWKSIEQENEKLFDELILKNKEIKELLDNYYRKFGGRFANELKLESTDIEEDFKEFAQIIKIYSNSYIKYNAPTDIILPGGIFKKVITKVILSKFKKYAKQREELRLLRSNSFSIVRKIFRRVGQLFFENGIIKEKSDIFYLYIDEIFSWSNFQEIPNLDNTVIKRKNDYKNYRKVNLPSHFAISSGEMPPIINKVSILPKIIQGQPCSSGIIKGKVKIFRDFFLPQKIDFDIIVASHTDPGWTSLIGISKGLIIEHGGILSHASIVSRELGRPAVIGVAGATEFLKDGQTVELNGSTGMITCL